jgi:dipeptidyl-peptidase-4
MKYDLDSMITSTFWRDAQTTWVEFIEDMKIMDDGSGYLITSNRDGWKDLLYYNFDGELLARLTTKDGGIGSVQTIDYKNNTIYFSAFLEKTTESQLYSVKFDGKLLTKLTKAAGNHTCSVSPNGSYFTDSYSSIDSPRKMDLCDGTGKVVRQLGSAESETLKNLKLGKAEIFTIPTDDGYNLPATWVLPPDFDKSKKYPVIIEVYGGPGIKTVYNSFPSMTRFYLAQSGIISMTLDNRGTGHFGKKGENEMYRNLGKCEINDLITAAKYLGKLSFVDTAKIGVTGASYGGYVTCMALTVGSDYFHYGIAEYAPTDWQLYDNIYTERYMDLPSGNKDGYNYANVMNHLDKYKGGLRIVHGTMDDNVHLQNVWQLTSKLQDMNKDFEMMIYIDERHGIHPPKSKHLSRNNLQFWFRKLLGKEFEE